MPEIEAGATSIEVTDWDDNTAFCEVPSAAVLRLAMPRISANLPLEVQQFFKESAGLGLVACRVINTHEDLASVELPSEPPTTIVVSIDQLAHPVSQ